MRSPAARWALATTLSAAIARISGESIEWRTMFTWYVCDGPEPSTVRSMGIMSALSPIIPMMPVERSCRNEPTIAPVLANLNELARLGMTLTISDWAIGKLTSPMSRNGWPKA